MSLCVVHGKNRSLQSLEQINGTDRFQCTPSTECKIGSGKPQMFNNGNNGNAGNAGNAANAGFGDAQVEEFVECVLHGKKRSMRSMQRVPGTDSYQCTPGNECQMGKNDPGSFDPNVDDTRLLCSIHNKYRSAMSVDVLKVVDGVPTYKCKVGFECQVAGSGRGNKRRNRNNNNNRFNPYNNFGFMGPMGPMGMNMMNMGPMGPMGGNMGMGGPMGGNMGMGGPMGGPMGMGPMGGPMGGNMGGMMNGGMMMNGGGMMNGGMMNGGGGMGGGGGPMRGNRRNNSGRGGNNQNQTNQNLNQQNQMQNLNQMPIQNQMPNGIPQNLM